MTKEGAAKIVNFITVGAGDLMLGRGYISHCSDYALSPTLRYIAEILPIRRKTPINQSSTLSIYITLIAIVLMEYNAAFRCQCLFSFVL